MRFTGADQAVRFAFNVSRRVEYTMADPLRVRGTGGDSLTPSELHAQAAMIMRRVDALPQLEQCSVYAQYGYGIERDTAIQLLAENLAINGLGVEQKRVCLSNWVTRRPTIRTIAKDFGVSYRKAYAWRSSVVKEYDRHLIRAVSLLEDGMFGEGGFVLR